MTTSGITVEQRDILSSVARSLIGPLSRELAAVSSEEGPTHLRLDPWEVAEGQGAFLVAFRGDVAVGCGAVRRIDTGTGELKRMYVAAEVRGLGVGHALLVSLEAEARRLGLVRIVLETGVRQTRALSLYERNGYTRVPPVGEYVGSPLSVCLEKNV